MEKLRTFGLIMILVFIFIILQLLYGWLAAIIVTTIIILFTKYALKQKRSFTISCQTEVKWTKSRYNIDNWNSIPVELTKLESAWLYFMCISKSTLVSLKLDIHGKLFYVFADIEPKRMTAYKRNRQSVVWERLYSYRIANNYIPYEPQSFKMGDMSEERLIFLASTMYEDIYCLDDIFKIDTLNTNKLFN